MREEVKNIIAASVLLLFSLIMIVWAIPTQISVNALLGASESAIDSRWFPYVVSGGIGALALAELIISLVKLRRSATENGVEKKSSEDTKGILRALAVFGLFVVYALAFNYIGFIPASIVIPPIVLFIMGGRNWKYYVSYLVMVAIVYVIFVYGLNINIR